jgi:DNA-binding transcriptional MerR regulator
LNLYSNLFRFRYGKDERIIGNGSAGISLEDFDAEEFFRLMFGGEEFIDTIGDFELAKSFKYAISEMLKDTEQTPESKEEQQRKRSEYLEERQKAHEKRIEQLSSNLKNKLSIFTDALLPDSDQIRSSQALNQFIEVNRSDIENLLQAPYGEHLLHSIGYIYSSKSRLWSSKMDSQEGHIGKRIIGFGKHIQSSWKERVHVVKETVKTVKCAVQWGQSMSKLAKVADQESIDSQGGNDSQYPFQHHSGHLEYAGFTPSESTASPSVTSSSTTSNTTTSVTPKQERKSSARPIVPLTDEEKRKLEADTAAKSMEALWRATKLEIESIERDVCDRVLGDQLSTRETRRRRCIGLLKMGELWQEAHSNRPTSTPSDSP